MNTNIKTKRVSSIQTLAEEYCINADNYGGIKLESIGLSIGAINYLLRANVRTVGDLLKLSESQLYEIKNIGQGSIQKIRESIERLVKNKYKPISSNKRFDNNNFKEQVSISHSIKLKKYREAADIIGNEISEKAYNNPEKFIPLIETFNTYLTDAQNKKFKLKKVKKLIDLVPLERQSKKALPFIEAYTNIKEKKDLLKLFYDENSAINEIIINSDFDERACDELILFLEWLPFNLIEIISSFVESLFEDEVLKSYVRSRLDGETIRFIAEKLEMTETKVYSIERIILRKMRLLVSKYSLTNLMIALNNGSEIITGDKMSEIFGSYKESVTFYLRRLYKEKNFIYDPNLDFLCVTLESAEHLQRLKNKLGHIIFCDELEATIKNVMDEIPICEDIICQLIEKRYTKYEKVYYYGALTNLSVYSTILKRYYPKGIKISDENEINIFIKRIKEYFGDMEITLNKAIITSGIINTGISCDKGCYIHRDYIVISDKVISVIEDYIQNSDKSSINISDLYNELYDLLNTETNITNWYMLQGVLKVELKGKFTFRYGKIARYMV